MKLGGVKGLCATVHPVGGGGVWGHALPEHLDPPVSARVANMNIDIARVQPLGIT